MRMILLDRDLLCSQDEREAARRRLFFGLARFAYRIKTVVILFTDVPGECHRGVRCQIKVDIEDRGIVIVDHLADAVDRAASAAADAVECRVAEKIDRRTWFRNPRGNGEITELLKRSRIFSAFRRTAYPR